MGYSNSSLVSYTRLSPNNSGKRTHSIDRITPHCVVGQLSVETLGGIFAPTSRKASCQYAIGSDGRIALICEEKNRSWCSSSSLNDNRAVTIECASDAAHPYAFNKVVYDRLIDLCVDICKRNGKTRLIWIKNKATALNYEPAGSEMLLTVHRWFANKACPGDWLMARMSDLATQVTKQLNKEQKGEDELTNEDYKKIQNMIDTSIRNALNGKDQPASEWAVNEGVVSWAESEGITDGSRPQGYAKREELWATLKRLVSKGD